MLSAETAHQKPFEESICGFIFTDLRRRFLCLSSAEKNTQHIRR
ncbi:hypothetical protein AtDm6_3441 [Acetobacter tropicalis]|uniref:Uncharacterized protein n=1 Tax=Acetobacter tropicalis TaxID=104102 RepID=A0A095AVQ5_9PROT|nr:hypothetical protein AtDm6_3441 [Acetobacter tropicalis]